MKKESCLSWSRPKQHSEDTRINRCSVTRCYWFSGPLVSESPVSFSNSCATIKISHQIWSWTSNKLYFAKLLMSHSHFAVLHVKTYILNLLHIISCLCTKGNKINYCKNENLVFLCKCLESQLPAAIILILTPPLSRNCVLFKTWLISTQIFLQKYYLRWDYLVALLCNKTDAQFTQKCLCRIF